MSAPRISKTWNVYPNTFLSFAGRPGGWNERVQQRAKLLVAIKNKLVQMGWTVVRSCGGSAGRGSEGFPGYAFVVSNGDNWPDWGWVVYNTRGNAHSWIVLKPPASLSTNYTFCIEWMSDNNQIYEGGWCCFFIAPRGHDLTTGNTGYPPTEKTIGGYGQFAWNPTGWGGSTWGTTGAANYDWHIHGVSSADGKQHRLFTCFNGVVNLAFTMDRLDNPVPSTTAWSEPVLSSFTASGYTSRTNCWCMSYERFNDGAPLYTRWNDGSASTFYLVAEGYGNAATGQNDPCWHNDFTGNYPLYPVSVYCLGEGDGKHRGRVGVLTDTWWAQYWMVDGTLFTTQDSRKLALFNNLVFPWNEEATPQFGELGINT